jgi:hypothetical protein
MTPGYDLIRQMSCVGSALPAQRAGLRLYIPQLKVSGQQHIVHSFYSPKLYGKICTECCDGRNQATGEHDVAAKARQLS